MKMIFTNSSIKTTEKWPEVMMSGKNVKKKIFFLHIRICKHHKFNFFKQ